MYFREELGILLKSRLFWILLAGSMAINIWILANYTGQSPLVKTSAKFKADGTDDVTEENWEMLIQALEDAEPINAQVSIRSIMKGTIQLSQMLSAADLADVYIDELRLTGDAAAEARKAYETLEPYILRDRKEGTANAFFVPSTNRFFELFSRYLPLACIAESVLAGVLLTLLCVNAPYDSRMKDVVYTTKAGRQLNRIKPAAAFSASAIFSATVWGSAFGLAGILLPMGKLWEVKVGSMMMLDSFYPIVCRFSVSLRTYLLLQAALSVCVALLFSAAACLFVEKSHRTAAAFFELAFVCAAIAVFSKLFSRNSRLLFLARFNPVDFAMKAGRYFASGGTFLSVRYYEAALMLFWGTLLAAGLLWQDRRLRKEDI